LLWEHLVSKFKKPIGQIEIGQPLHGCPPKILSYASTDRVSIGKFCSIAPDVTIVAASGQHIMNLTVYPGIGKPPKNAKSEVKTVKQVKIGNDVWIGTGVIILNVSIGDGAIIGSGAVVSEDIPPYAVAVGVPAKVIRYRFTAQQISKMLKIKWWNWSSQKLRENEQYFSSNNIEGFVAKFAT
jgi:virginiamycin A acetyltransferase